MRLIMAALPIQHAHAKGFIFTTDTSAIQIDIDWESYEHIEQPISIHERFFDDHISCDTYKIAWTIDGQMVRFNQQ